MTRRCLFRSIYGAEEFSLSRQQCAEQHSCVHRQQPRAFAPSWPRLLHSDVRCAWSVVRANLFLPPFISLPPPSRFAQPRLAALPIPVLFPQHCSRFINTSTFPMTHHHHYHHHHDLERGLGTLVMIQGRGRLSRRWGVNQCRHALSQQHRAYAKKAKKTLQKLSEDDIDVIDLDRVSSSMEAAINALKYEYTNSIITRITPATLDKVSVEIEGEWFQLKQVAQIGMPNSQTIIINISSYPQATESFMAALRDADLNLNPILEKNVIKVPIPKMTKELRESLVKVAKAAAEKCKVGVRKARQKAMADLKKKSGVSKDSVRRLEKHIQEVTDKHNGRIEELFKAKSTELLKGS